MQIFEDPQSLELFMARATDGVSPESTDALVLIVTMEGEGVVCKGCVSLKKELKNLMPGLSATGIHNIAKINVAVPGSTKMYKTLYGSLTLKKTKKVPHAILLDPQKKKGKRGGRIESGSVSSIAKGIVEHLANEMPETVNVNPSDAKEARSNETDTANAVADAVEITKKDLSRLPKLDDELNLLFCADNLNIDVITGKTLKKGFVHVGEDGLNAKCAMSRSTALDILNGRGHCKCGIKLFTEHIRRFKCLNRKETDEAISGAMGLAQNPTGAALLNRKGSQKAAVESRENADEVGRISSERMDEAIDILKKKAIRDVKGFEALVPALDAAIENMKNSNWLGDLMKSDYEEEEICYTNATVGEDEEVCRPVSEIYELLKTKKVALDTTTEINLILPSGEVIKVIPVEVVALFTRDLEMMQAHSEAMRTSGTFVSSLIRVGLNAVDAWIERITRDLLKSIRGDSEDGEFGLIATAMGWTVRGIEKFVQAIMWVFRQILVNKGVVIMLNKGFAALRVVVCVFTSSFLLYFNTRTEDFGRLISQAVSTIGRSLLIRYGLIHWTPFVDTVADALKTAAPVLRDLITFGTTGNMWPLWVGLFKMGVGWLLTYTGIMDILQVFVPVLKDFINLDGDKEDTSWSIGGFIRWVGAGIAARIWDPAESKAFILSLIHYLDYGNIGIQTEKEVQDVLLPVAESAGGSLASWHRALNIAQMATLLPRGMAGVFQKWLFSAMIHVATNPKVIVGEIREDVTEALRASRAFSGLGQFLSVASDTYFPPWVGKIVKYGFKTIAYIMGAMKMGVIYEKFQLSYSHLLWSFWDRLMSTAIYSTLGWLSNQDVSALYESDPKPSAYWLAFFVTAVSGAFEVFNIGQSVVGAYNIVTNLYSGVFKCVIPSIKLATMYTKLTDFKQLERLLLSCGCLPTQRKLREVFDPDREDTGPGGYNPGLAKSKAKERAKIILNNVDDDDDDDDDDNDEVKDAKIKVDKIVEEAINKIKNEQIDIISKENLPEPADDLARVRVDGYIKNVTKHLNQTLQGELIERVGNLKIVPTEVEIERAANRLYNRAKDESVQKEFLNSRKARYERAVKEILEELAKMNKVNSIPPSLPTDQEVIIHIGDEAQNIYRLHQEELYNTYQTALKDKLAIGKSFDGRVNKNKDWAQELKKIRVCKIEKNKEIIEHFKIFRSLFTTKEDKEKLTRIEEKLRTELSTTYMYHYNTAATKVFDGLHDAENAYTDLLPPKGVGWEDWPVNMTKQIYEDLSGKDEICDKLDLMCLARRLNVPNTRAQNKIIEYNKDLNEIAERAALEYRSKAKIATENGLKAVNEIDVNKMVFEAIRRNDIVSRISVADQLLRNFWELNRDTLATMKNHVRTRDTVIKAVTKKEAEERRRMNIYRDEMGHRREEALKQELRMIYDVNMVDDVKAVAKRAFEQGDVEYDEEQKKLIRFFESRVKQVYEKNNKLPSMGTMEKWFQEDVIDKLKKRGPATSESYESIRKDYNKRRNERRDDFILTKESEWVGLHLKNETTVAILKDIETLASTLRQNVNRLEDAVVDIKGPKTKTKYNDLIKLIERIHNVETALNWLQEEGELMVKGEKNIKLVSGAYDYMEQDRTRLITIRNDANNKLTDFQIALKLDEVPYIPHNNNTRPTSVRKNEELITDIAKARTQILKEYAKGLRRKGEGRFENIETALIEYGELHAKRVVGTVDGNIFKLIYRKWIGDGLMGEYAERRGWLLKNAAEKIKDAAKAIAADHVKERDSIYVDILKTVDWSNMYDGMYVQSIKKRLDQVFNEKAIKNKLYQQMRSIVKKQMNLYEKEQIKLIKQKLKLEEEDNKQRLKLEEEAGKQRLKQEEEAVKIKSREEGEKLKKEEVTKQDFVEKQLRAHARQRNEAAIKMRNRARVQARERVQQRELERDEKERWKKEIDKIIKHTPTHLGPVSKIAIDPFKVNSVINHVKRMTKNTQRKGDQLISEIEGTKGSKWKEMYNYWFSLGVKKRKNLEMRNKKLLHEVEQEIAHVQKLYEIYGETFYMKVQNDFERLNKVMRDSSEIDYRFRVEAPKEFKKLEEVEQLQQKIKVSQNKIEQLKIKKIKNLELQINKKQNKLKEIEQLQEIEVLKLKIKKHQNQIKKNEQLKALLTEKQKRLDIQAAEETTKVRERQVNKFRALKVEEQATKARQRMERDNNNDGDDDDDDGFTPINFTPIDFTPLANARKTRRERDQKFEDDIRKEREKYRLVPPDGPDGWWPYFKKKMYESPHGWWTYFSENMLTLPFILTAIAASLKVLARNAGETLLEEAIPIAIEQATHGMVRRSMVKAVGKTALIVVKNALGKGNHGLILDLFDD